MSTWREAATFGQRGLAINSWERNHSRVPGYYAE